jgi:hypothetical protein
MMIVAMEAISILHLQEHWSTLVISIWRYLTRLYVDDSVVPARSKTKNEIYRIKQTGTWSLQNCKTEFHSIHMPIPTCYDNNKYI